MKRGPCRGCGADTSAIPMSWHHLVGRDLGGDDVPQNLIPLGGCGTMYCHGIFENHSAGEDCRGRWRTWQEIAAEIRAGLLPAERAYILTTKGLPFLDRYYPEGGTQ